MAVVRLLTVLAAALSAIDAIVTMDPNATTIECGEAAAVVERVNCTITTRSALTGEPAPGATADELEFVAAPELLSPSPLYGGPVHWYVDFGTCLAGSHNVTVHHAASNASAIASVVPSRVSNFTLDCRRGVRSVVAGSRVTCAVTTVDVCGNPSYVPTEMPSSWSVGGIGAALQPSKVLAAHAADGVGSAAAAAAAANAARVGGGEGTQAFVASFDTGKYWSAELNYTEWGTAGLQVVYSNANCVTLTPLPCHTDTTPVPHGHQVVYSNANWTETRTSVVGVRAAALEAAQTRVGCSPVGGLLEGHYATCYVTTFDRFENPQVGASPADFVVTYLSNPGPLNAPAGSLSPTPRLDTFSIRFQSFEEGTAVRKNKQHPASPPSVPHRVPQGSSSVTQASPCCPTGRHRLDGLLGRRLRPFDDVRHDPGEPFTLTLTLTLTLTPTLTLTLTLTT